MGGVYARLQTQAQSRRLTPAQVRTLMHDAHVACERMLELISLKMNLWTCLPWKLCALAHWCIGTARRFAQECLNDFDAILLENATRLHHRVSLYFLHPDGPMRRHIEAFVAGAAMCEELLQAVMMLRIVSVVERTIEREHVAPGKKLKGKATFRGASVSTVSHLPEMMSLVNDGHKLQELLTIFAQSRSIKWLVHELGFRRHPEILKLCGKTGARVLTENHHAKLWPLLQSLVYRDCADMQHLNLLDEQRFNEHAKKTEKRRAEQLLGPAVCKRAKVSHPDLFKFKFALAHLKEMSCGTRVYRFPLHTLSLVPVARALNGDHSEWSWNGLAHAGDNMAYIRFLDPAAGKKKTMQLPHAARSRSLFDGDATITLHTPLDGYTSSSPMISLHAVAPHLNDDRNLARSFILTGFKCSFAELLFCAEELPTESALSYALECEGLDTEIDPLVNKDICHSLLEASALPGSSFYVPVKDSWKPYLQVLIDSDRLRCDDENGRGIQFTEWAMHSLQYGEMLHSPRLVMETRPGIPLENLTTLECIMELESDAMGFSWAPLPKKVAEREGLQYVVGGSKIWYSTPETVPIRYLQCLLAAEHLKTRGVEAIPHWVPRDADHFYSVILMDAVVPPRPKLRSQRALALDDDLVEDVPALEDARSLLLHTRLDKPLSPTPPPALQVEYSDEESFALEDEPVGLRSACNSTRPSRGLDTC